MQKNNSTSPQPTPLQIPFDYFKLKDLERTSIDIEELQQTMVTLATTLEQKKLKEERFSFL